MIFPKKPVLVLLILFLPIGFSLNGQISTYSNDYLNIGTDASAMAKGNAAVAGISGVNAGYWNPAGLIGQNQRFEFSLMHANYFSGLANYDCLGISFKASDSLSMGLTILRFGVDDIPNTLELVDENGNVDYDRITYFSVADYAFLFSMARQTKIAGLSLGGSAKFIYRHQGQFANAYGFGFDIGAQFQKKHWKFGAVLRDASSTFNLWVFNKEAFEEIFLSTENEIPENGLEISLPKLLTGVARTFRFNEKITAQVEFNTDWYFDGKRNSIISINPVTLDPKIGFEIGYLKNVYIRAGLNNFQKFKDFNGSEKIKFQIAIGAGIQFFRISIDYALTDPGNLSITPLSHIISLKYSPSKL